VTFPSDTAGSDPRYGPRRRRHLRGRSRRYHSRSRRGAASLNDGLARRDWRILYDLFRLAAPQRAQPPIGTNTVRFSRQEKLCVVIRRQRRRCGYMEESRSLKENLQALPGSRGPP